MNISNSTRAWHGLSLSLTAALSRQDGCDAASPMRLRVVLGIFLAVLLGQACGNAKTHSHAATPAPAAPAAPAAVQVGTVVPREAITGKGAESYAYYLPKSADLQSPCRVVIFLDAHARGMDPVKMYKPIAEEFGWLLVGSNVSQNGQQPAQSLAIYDGLLHEIATKFKIDEQHLTLAGFSGGARVAALIAQSRPGIVQVVGCSAGYQPRQGDAFGYFGIAGLEDFNYWEMYDLEAALQASPQPHAFQFFPGGHAWPPLNVMQNAIEFSFFKWAAKPAADSTRAQLRMKSFDNELKAAQDNFDPYWQVRAYDAVIGSMGAFVDLAPLQAGRAKVLASPQFARAKAKLDANRDMEMVMRNTYVQQLGTKGVEDWRRLASDLRSGKLTTAGADHFTDLRILNFISLNTYFQVDGAYKAGDLGAMEHFLQIYAFVDPTNPEHEYLTAVLRMRQNRPVDAIAALQAARVIGFKDAERMAADPDLAGLRNDAAFQQMLTEMRTE